MKKKSIKKKLTRIIKLEELNWKEIEELEKDKAIFFLPISPLEEHGPYLPVGTDLLMSQDAAVESIKIL